MAKKGFLGTVISVAATVAAVGGACYIFRDKIKESKLYKDLNMDERLTKLKNYWDEHKPCKEAKEDFFDEDEYVFEDAQSTDRNYVSVSFTQNDDAFDDTEDSFDFTIEENKTDVVSVDEHIDEAIKPAEEKVAETTAPIETDAFDVPVISIDTTETTEETIEAPAEEGDDSPSGYDMEGLSDVSEDPDVLMEQDLLDEAPTL